MLKKYLNLLKSGHFLNMPTHCMRREKPVDDLVFWALAGKGRVASEGKEVQVRTGDLISLRPGKPHEYQSDPRDPWEIVWVHFDGQLAAAFVDKIRGFGEVRTVLGLDDEIRDRWLELVIAHAAHGPGFEIRANTALYGLLGLIIHRLLLKTRIPSVEKRVDVHRLQNHIHHHLDKPITLGELARQAGLSVPHFNRVFRKLFQVSPMHYVLQKRIARACTLLTETSMPVKQISRAVSYDDPYYFSRLFRKMMGISPSEYRRKKQPRLLRPGKTKKLTA